MLFPHTSCRWGTNCRTPPDRTLESSDSEDVPSADTVYCDKITSHHCVESTDCRIDDVGLVVWMRRFDRIVVLREDTRDSAADADDTRIESGKPQQGFIHLLSVTWAFAYQSFRGGLSRDRGRRCGSRRFSIAFDPDACLMSAATHLVDRWRLLLVL